WLLLPSFLLNNVILWKPRSSLDLLYRCSVRSYMFMYMYVIHYRPNPRKKYINSRGPGLPHLHNNLEYVDEYSVRVVLQVYDGRTKSQRDKLASDLELTIDHPCSGRSGGYVELQRLQRLTMEPGGFPQADVFPSSADY